MAAGAAIDQDELDSIQNPPQPTMQLPTAPPQAQSPTTPAVQNPGSATSAGGAAPTLTGQPAQPGIGQQPQKKQIDTGPQVQFDPKKLAKVQTAQDLVEAMRPKSRTEYLDWWEKTHGDIDDKYDNMQKQLGERPTDEGLTRQEKFAGLLQFGLHLMKASSAPTTNQGGVLAGQLSDSVDSMNAAHQANIKGQQSSYDASSNAIENARQQEQKSIGTAADARKGQMQSDKDYASETKDNASAFKDVSDALNTKQSALGPATYSAGPDGTLHSINRDPDTGQAVAQPVLGIDGKPYKGKVLGREAGSGIDKGDPKEVRIHKYLTSVLGIDPDKSAKIAFKAKTGDPTADKLGVYKAVLAATGGDQRTADLAGNNWVMENYGPGAVARSNAPLISPQGDSAPTAQALAGLKPGMTRDFGSKGVWTLGLDGTPRLMRMPGGGSTNPIQNPGAALPAPGAPAPNASP